MSAIEVLLLSVALAMDAFAIAVCVGLSCGNKLKARGTTRALCVGLYFGVFQGIMPVVGHFAGSVFAGRVAAIDHWAAFVILTILGINMVVNSFKAGDDKKEEISIGPYTMIPLAFAGSIDALATGVSLAFKEVEILPIIISIAVTTFVFSIIGVKLGGLVGNKFKTMAERIGGLVLIGLAIFSLLQGR